MATLAYEDERDARGAGPPPISAHPAFSTIVALWFAALLGLGSLILPVALLERLASVTGIATLIPSAAPPLGFAARATLSFAGAVFGAVIGLLLARQVAHSQAPRPRPRFASDDGYRCKPILAHDELGEEGLGQEGPGRPRPAAGTRRRALATVEDSAPSEYLLAAPLPGQDPHAYQGATDALELSEFAEGREPDDGREDQDPAMTENPSSAPTPDHAAGGDERREFMPGLPHTLDPVAGPEQELGGATEPPDALPFSAPSLRRTAVPEDASAGLGDGSAIDADAPSPAAPIPRAFEPPPEAAPHLSVVDWSEEDEPDAGAERPLEELGLVQLATRLGGAIERRRALRSQRSETAAAPCQAFAAAEDFGAAEAEEAARARADYFGAPLRDGACDASGRPSPLAEIDFEEDDYEEDDLSASFSLPLRNRTETPQATPAAFGSEDEDEDEDEEEVKYDAAADDEEYSSLLAMKNPFRQKDDPVRIDEPEPDGGDGFEATVTFPERKLQATPSAAPAARSFDPPGNVAHKPTAAPRNPDDAERELRAALETLQRMSGAA